ncbi:hypothetical protein CLF_113364, partial [Clonorchis sinensis]
EYTIAITNPDEVDHDRSPRFNQKCRTVSGEINFVPFGIKLPLTLQENRKHLANIMSERKQCQLDNQSLETSRNL